MRNAPTELELLDTIYEKYYDAFAAYDDKAPSRGSKNYVPIDIDAVGRALGVDPEIVFGLLYYHLEKKYGYDVPSGLKDRPPSRMHFFAMGLGGERHCIHFPYLAGVVAGLRSDDRKYRLATTMAVVSFVISLVSFGLSLSGKF
jgi:hypothetical protein